MFTSKNIRYLRETKGITQQEFAKLFNISDKAVSTWELGLKEPRMGRVQDIAEYFNVNVSDIIFKDLTIKEETPEAEAAGVSELSIKLLEITQDFTDSDKQELLKFADFLKSKHTE